MSLCDKCRLFEATIEFHVAMNGKEEFFRLCPDCALLSGVPSMDPVALEAMSVVGKTCGFCGRAATSGVSGTAGIVYWCDDCGAEYGQILGELNEPEPADGSQRSADASFLTLGFDTEFKSRAEGTSQKAIEILKNRRCKNRSDEGVDLNGQS